jgi:alkylation response protein AidB-like acyl-CoA dehydrogenase
MYKNSDILRQIIQEFGRTHIIPYRQQWDEAQTLPNKLFKQLGELGMMGSAVPKKYGGSSFTLVQYMTVIETFAKLDAAVALSLLAHNSLCIGHIRDYGNIIQQEKWLSKLSLGVWIGAWALTEPEAGSDVRNLKTVAHRAGDGWVLNGKKHFITNGQISNLVVVIAKTSVEGKKKSMSAFVVEKDNEGVHVGHKDDKMGMRAAETVALIFKDCYVPSENLLGEVGQGWSQVMHVLEEGRIAMAALGLGIAKWAFSTAMQHAQKRYQFRKPLIRFQGVSFPLAELGTQIEAAQALMQRAAVEKIHCKVAPKLVSMSKLMNSELAVKATHIAMQVLGGYGYMKNTPLEKYYRDARLCTIGEGTSEIQKVIIIKALLAEAS